MRSDVIRQPVSARQNVLIMVWAVIIGIAYYMGEPVLYERLDAPLLKDIYDLYAAATEAGLSSGTALRLAYKADFAVLVGVAVFCLFFVWPIVQEDHFLKTNKWPPEAAWKSRADILSPVIAVLFLVPVFIVIIPDVMINASMLQQGLVSEHDDGNGRAVFLAYVLPYITSLAGLLLALILRMLIAVPRLMQAERPEPDFSAVPGFFAHPWGLRKELHQSLRQRVEESGHNFRNHDALPQLMSWLFGVIFAICAYNKAAAITGISDVMAALGFVALALLLLPIARKKVFVLTGESLSSSIRGMLVFMLLIYVGIMTM